MEAANQPQGAVRFPLESWRYCTLEDTSLWRGLFETKPRWPSRSAQLCMIHEAGYACEVLIATAVVPHCSLSRRYSRRDRGIQLNCSDPRPDVSWVSHSSLIRACAKCGDVARAQCWFEHTQGRGVRADVVLSHEFPRIALNS